MFNEDVRKVLLDQLASNIKTVYPDAMIEESYRAKARAQEPPKKFDLGKPRWQLLPWDTLTTVVEVMMLGAAKYGDFNWKGFHLDEVRQRYGDAAQRHLVAYFLDHESRDPESGEPHLAHLICCTLILLWHEQHDLTKPEEESDTL